METDVEEVEEKVEKVKEEVEEEVEVKLETLEKMKEACMELPRPLTWAFSAALPVPKAAEAAEEVEAKKAEKVKEVKKACRRDADAEAEGPEFPKASSTSPFSVLR